MNLVIAPHLDDETLGCYSFSKNSFILVICEGLNKKDKDRIRTFTKNYNNFKILKYRDCELSFKDIKEISNTVSNLVNEIRPKTILIPCELDLHQDHQIVSRACKVALKRIPKYVDEILEYKIFGNYQFSEVHFDTIKDLNNDLVYNKISILKSYIANKQNIDLYELPNCEMFRTIFRRI